MKCSKKNTFLVALLVFSFLILLNSSNKVSAITCDCPGSIVVDGNRYYYYPCQPNPWNSENYTMCCTGNGCPSWVCVSQSNETCVWDSYPGVCTGMDKCPCISGGWSEGCCGCEWLMRPQDTCTYCEDPDSPPTNYTPKGYHDVSDCDDDFGYITAGGWACDQNDYTADLDIHFYMDGDYSTGTFIGSTTAGSLREAAVGTQCGGDRNHGFSFTSSSAQPSGTHTVYAYAINTPSGTNKLLTNSPKTVTCRSTPDPPINYTPKGDHNASGCNDFGYITAYGWACDENDYTADLDIHLYMDGDYSTGTFIGSTTAGLLREAAVGTQCGGDSRHGFSFTSSSAQPSGTHTVYAYAINTPSGTNKLLTNSPKPVICGLPCEINHTYDLNVYVKDASGGCDSLGGVEPEVSVTVLKKSGSIYSSIFDGDTSGDGMVSLTDIPTSDSILYFQASKTSYRQICPSFSPSMIDLDPQDCDVKTVNLGIAPIDAKSWKTVIDGDLYAVGVGVDISEGTKLGGFGGFLINQGISDSGGYALSSLDFTTSRDRIIEDKGGYAASFGSNHNDKALERLTFNPPDHAEIIENLSHPFEDGGVYSIAVSDFNDSLENSDVIYSISPGPSGIAILYVTNIKVLPSGLSVSTTGPNPLYFEHSLTTSGSGRLILVIQSDDTYISKDIGYADFLTGTYTINSQPNIQGAIISKGNITFDTKTFNPAAAKGDPVELDMPIMMLGPLVSRLNIALNRDLGASANDNYPAISIQHDQTLMCKISDLEKSKASEGYRNYTGLKTYDLQFDYEY